METFNDVEMARRTEVTNSLLLLQRQSRDRLDGESADSAQWFDTHLEMILSDDWVSDPQMYVEVLLLFVQWYFKEGRSDHTLALGSRAVAVSRQADLKALLRRSLNQLGAIYTHAGDLPQASVCYVEALQIADDIGDRVGKVAVLTNLSAARFNAGLIAESIALNQYAIELATGGPHMRQLVAEAHHNMAVAYVLLEDIESAFNEIRAAIDLFVDVKSQFWTHHRVILELTHAKILIKLGRLEEAKQSAHAANIHAERLNSRLANTQASLASILCEANEGAPLTALNRLEKLRALVKKNEPGYRDFLEVELQCNILAGRHEFAEHSQELHLENLAQFQRHAAIQQVAAFQRSISTWGSVAESRLLALPKRTRVQLINSWGSSEKTEMMREQLEAIASLADQRDDWSGEHSMRVGRLVHLLAQFIGYGDHEAGAIGFAAHLHDIGRLATPDALLLKRSGLVSGERAIVRRHTVEGCQMLADILSSMERHKIFANAKQIGVLRLAAEVAHAHHEWWDGSGYPRGLRGVAIPEAARITALADAFDELTNARPYKEPCSVDDAMSQITGLSGKQFEPRLCDAFARLIKRLQAEHGPELKGFAPREEELSPYQIANRVIERIVEQAGGRSEMRGARHHAPELTVV